MPVVAAIVGALLALDLLILRSPDQKIVNQIGRGIVGLVLGSAVFHVIVVLFGAPVVEYVRVLSSCRSGPIIHCCCCVLVCGCRRCCWLCCCRVV